MPYQWSFGFLWHYGGCSSPGVEITLAYTFGTILLGLLLGLLIGMARLSQSWLLNAPLVALTEVFRCTPLLVQIVWFYYALPVMLGVQIPATVGGGGGAVALHRRLLRRDLPRRHRLDRARAVGRGARARLATLVADDAAGDPAAGGPADVPPFMNQSIIQLKNTSLVSTIAVPDLLYQGQLITADTYRPLETYTVVAVIYFVLLFPTTVLAQAWEKRLARG